ncbi:hypothetical protein EJB05_25082, partial [Eragrostis curvula]
MAMSSLVVCAVLAACVSAGAAQWSPATATYYGGPDGNGTMGGACGYGNLYHAGYGIDNAALSPALFNGGASCGQCYAVMCDTSKSSWCRAGSMVTVTATNLCPPSPNSERPNLCNQPRQHLDMSQPAWEKIGAYNQDGIIPVVYQRVKCSRSGGVRFVITGSSSLTLVNIQNLAGSGSVAIALIKGTNTGWISMSRNWGANWQTNRLLVGQALSFAITSTGGQFILFLDLVPASWYFGQTFTSDKNFDY